MNKTKAKITYCFLEGFFAVGEEPLDFSWSFVELASSCFIFFFAWCFWLLLRFALSAVWFSSRRLSILQQIDLSVLLQILSVTIAVRAVQPPHTHLLWILRLGQECLFLILYNLSIKVRERQPNKAKPYQHDI